MSGMQRNKGKAGEREIAALVRDLTGWDVRRRVRQHDGDSDLEGVPGWSVEVKRHRSASAADVAAWWRQAVAQAGVTTPVLFYRLDRCDWRAVWPLAVLLVHQSAEYWSGIEWTATTSIAAWAAVARDASMARCTESQWALHGLVQHQHSGARSAAHRGASQVDRRAGSGRNVDSRARQSAGRRKRIRED